MLRLLAGLLLLVLPVDAAAGPYCDPQLFTVPPILLVPNNPNTLSAPLGPNSLGYTVGVVCQTGPLVNAIVEVELYPNAWNLLSKCDGADGNPAFCDTSPHNGHYTCSAVTNTQGSATFLISGGGCLLPGDVEPYTSEVRVNGVVVRVDLKIFSPDAVNLAGQTTGVSGTSNCENGSTSVGLSDAVFHTGDFAGITYNACSDFDDSGTANLADAVIGTQYIVNGNGCSCQ